MKFAKLQVRGIGSLLLGVFLLSSPKLFGETITITNVTDDTFIAEDDPDYVYGAEDYFFARQNQKWVPLIKFNISEIEDWESISSATLKIYCLSLISGASVTIRTHKFLTAWNEETMTWNTSHSYADEKAVKKPEETQFKYIRKSISLVPFLSRTKRVTIKEEESEYALKKIWESIKLERFDYNPLPAPLIEDFKDKAKAKLRVTEALPHQELKGLIQGALLPEIKKVLYLKAEIRAKELISETERASFIATKAKELGIVAEDLETVINSAYLCVPILSEYQVSKTTVKYIETKEVSKNVYKEVEVSKDAINYRVGLDILWYYISFKNGKRSIEILKPPSPGVFGKVCRKIGDFITYLERLGVLHIEKKIGSSHTAILDKEYKLKDEKVSPQTYAFRKAVGSEVSKLALKTKKLTPFRLGTPIKESSFNTVRFNLGKKEGLSMDCGFDVLEYVETKTDEIRQKKAGYVKVRKIGDNKREINPELSNAQIITGWSLEKGMVVKEHPLADVSLSLKYGYIPFHIDSGSMWGIYVEGVTTNAPTITLEIEGDIGAISKNPIFSESWLSFGFTGSLTRVKCRTLYTGKEKVSGGILGMAMGIRKKLYLRRFAPFLGLRGGFIHYTMGSPYDTTGSFDIYEWGIEPLGGLELFISPEFSLGVYAGYNFYLPKSKWSYEWKVNSTKHTEKNITGPELKTIGQTLQIYVNFNF